MKKKYKVCYGISSYCPDRTHIFMLDFDMKPLSTVVKACQTIQDLYNLSDMYIIRSENGYNVLTFDKTTLGLIYSIGLATVNADHDFFRFGFKRGYYVLRFGSDKEIVSILRNNSKKYEKSTAHAIFVSEFFNQPIDYDGTFDKNTTLTIVQYPSDKNGYHIVKSAQDLIV
jgi:hypothetical protein